jgi:hypothetical protein
MDITTQIFELRAELYGCKLTRRERRQAEAELTRLLDEKKAQDRAFAAALEAEAPTARM